MATVLGKDAIMYYDEAGAADGQATPANWLVNANVKDLSISLETSTFDVSTRASGSFRQIVSTLKDGTVTFQMVYNTTDAAFTAFSDAFFNEGGGFASAGGQVLGIAVMDGDITTIGNQGLVADMIVSNFSRSENLEEALMTDVEVAPTVSPTGFTPIWFTVV